MARRAVWPFAKRSKSGVKKMFSQPLLKAYRETISSGKLFLLLVLLPVKNWAKLALLGRLFQSLNCVPMRYCTKEESGLAVLDFGEREYHRIGCWPDTGSYSVDC